MTTNKEGNGRQRKTLIVMANGGQEMASTEVERPGAIEIPTDQAPSVVIDESAQILTVEFAEVPSAAPATTEQVSKKATKQKNERSPEKKRPNANNHHHQQSNQNNRRFRHDNDGRHFNKCGRKRSYSFNGGGEVT
ncbi:hypothetical protein B566_EDAN003666 [Ephemera danica]|nr:hypothetical protein B566_EDAN003666 [Ephemera danica]